MLIYILLSLLLVISIFSFIEEQILDKQRTYIYIGTAVVLVFLTAFRPIGMDNDSENYQQYFTDYDFPLYEMTVEYSFRLFSKWFYNLFGSVHSIFFLYALIGIGIKFYAIKRLTPLVFSAVVVYLGNYYILHEFTQIRAGVSSGFFLLSIIYVCRGDRLKALALMLAATFFHYSSIAMLPLLFISNRDMSVRQRMIWGAVIPLAYVMYFLHIGITSIPLPYIGDKMEAYDALKDSGLFDEINVFNMVFLVKIAIYLYLLYMYETVKEYNQYATIMIKMLGISILAFTGLASLPVMAFRVSEIYGVVEIVLYTCIYYTVKPSYIAKSAIVLIGLSMFLINVFYNEILHFT